MDMRFTQRQDGQVDVDLGPEWPLFNEALGDSISSLPPRGATGDGPSAYWVDVAARGLKRALATGSSRPFIWGNTTLLRLSGGKIEARHDFGDEAEPGQFLEVDDFLRLLGEWRVRIQRSAERAKAPLPETYRRNPSADVPP